MAPTDKNQVMVELYDLAISGEKKEDRFGRVVTGKSLNEDDLISIAVQRRTDIAAINVKVLGMAATGTIINSVTDVASGKENEIFTPGGSLNIAGNKIRVDGDKPAVGIKLINRADNTEIQIPKTAILINNPSNISLVTPGESREPINSKESMNMKKTLFILAVIVLIVASCTKDDFVSPGQAKNHDLRTLQLTADVPGTPDTRVAMQKVPNDTKSIRAEWQANDLINLGFLQDGAFAAAQIKVSAVNADGSAVFETLTIPATINPANPYVLYAAVNGTLSYVKSAVKFVCKPGLDVSLQSLSKRAPFYCRQDIPANAGEQRLRFRNIGSILSVHIKNTGETALPADMPTLTLSSGEAWYSLPSGFKVDAAVANPTFTPTAPALNMSVRGLSALPAGSSTTAYAWIVPSDMSLFNLKANIGNYAVTTVPKTIGQPLPQGKNIHLYLQVNMDDYEENDTPGKLEFVSGTNFGGINGDIPRITFTTDMAAGSTVLLFIDAEAADRPDIWIDLNNNGIKDAGEDNISFIGSTGDFRYTISSSTTTIYGKVVGANIVGRNSFSPDVRIKTVDVSGHTTLTYLVCDNNGITELDVSGARALESLFCTDNRITALDVSQSPALRKLACWVNELTTLDVSQNTNLIWLACHNNSLTALDVSRNNKLIRLECATNKIKALDVSQCTALDYLTCANNQISGGAMTTLVNSLVNRTGMKAGTFYGNVITDADKAIATGKNWIVVD